MSAERRVYVPRSAAVEAGEDGAPLALAGTAVEAIREEWVVEDRWWTAEPLRRHYYELVLADGRIRDRLPRHADRALAPPGSMSAERASVAIWFFAPRAKREIL